jgi:hypothetical protein
MPRVPEGKFNTEPSTRVPRATLPKVETGANKLRQMGGEFLKVSKALDTAKTRADVSAEAAGVEERYNKELVPFHENLIKNANKAGNVVGEDGKEIPIADAMKKEINRFNTEVQGESRANAAEVDNILAKYMVPNQQRMLRDTETAQSFRIKKGIQDTYKSDIQTLQAMSINESVSIDEYKNKEMEIKDKLSLDSEVLGLREAGEFGASIDNVMGLTAYQRVIVRGATKEEEAFGKSNIAKIKDEGLRLTTLNRFEATVKRVKENTIKQKYRDIKKISKATTPSEIIATANLRGSAMNDMENTSLVEFETPKMRIDGYVGLASSGIVSSLYFQNPDLKGSSPRWAAAIEEEVNKKYDSLEGKAILDLGVDFRSTMKDRVHAEVRKMEKLRDNDFKSFLDAAAPHITEMMASDSKKLREEGRAEYAKLAGWDEDSQTGANIRRDNRNFVGASELEGMKLASKEFELTDETGEDRVAEVTRQAELGDEFGLKRVDEYVKAEALDASSLYLYKFNDGALQLETSKAVNEFKNNLKVLEETGKFSSLNHRGGSKKAFKQRVRESIKLGWQDLNGLQNSEEGVSNLYMGAVDSIMYLAAQNSRVQGVGVRAGINDAISDFKSQFNVGTSGKATVSLSRKYALQNKIPFGEATDIARSARRLEHIESLGQSINATSMRQMFAGNAEMMRRFDSYEGLSKSNPGRAKLNFLKVFKDNIVVKPNPKIDNEISFYLKADNTQAFLPILTEGNAPISIPINDYYDKMMEAQAESDTLVLGGK